MICIALCLFWMIGGTPLCNASERRSPSAEHDLPEGTDRAHLLNIELFNAITAHKPEYVEKALVEGANVNASDDYGNTPLIRAIAQLKESSNSENLAVLEIIGRLLEEDTINVNAWSDTTALETAVRKNNWVLVKELLGRDANPNYTSSSDFRTPLMMAVSKGNTLIARALLKHGANVNAQDRERWTALMQAVATENKEMVSLLLEYDPDRTIKNKSRHTVLDIAATAKREIQDLLYTTPARRDAASFQPTGALEDFLSEQPTPTRPTEHTDSISPRCISPFSPLEMLSTSPASTAMTPSSGELSPFSGDASSISLSSAYQQQSPGFAFNTSSVSIGAASRMTEKPKPALDITNSSVSIDSNNSLEQSSPLALETHVVSEAIQPIPSPRWSTGKKFAVGGTAAAVTAATIYALIRYIAHRRRKNKRKREMLALQAHAQSPATTH